MPTQQLHPESFTGPSGGLKKATVWLASEDVGLGTELLVTIIDVERHRAVEFDKGRKEDIAALKFAEVEKRMVLNSTNRKMLVRMFGMDTGAWRGQRIALYVDPDVQMMGQKVNGLRLRPAPAVELADLPPGWDEWSNEERGANRAAKGLPTLQTWWATLPKAEKTRLKPMLDAEWKPATVKAGAQ